MISGQRLDPKFQNKVRDLIESGLSAEEVIQAFRDEDEDRAVSKEEGDSYSYELPVPDKIKVIAQALAYRRPEEQDAPAIHALINLSYRAECIGREAFRKDEPCISMEALEELLFEDDDHQWLIVEAPDRSAAGPGGIGESILGVMSYTTNGQSKRNGVVEGRLGSVRFFCVHPSYQRLYVGKRMLARLERQLFSDGCIRAMFSIPSPRDTVGIWLEDHGYRQVASVPYPAKYLGHELLNPDTPISLDMLQKPLTNPKSEPKKTVDGSGASSTSSLLSASALDDSSDPKAPLKQTGRMVLPPHWRGIYPPEAPTPAQESAQNNTSTSASTEPSSAVAVDAGCPPSPAPASSSPASSTTAVDATTTSTTAPAKRGGHVRMELSDTMAGLSFGANDDENTEA